MRLLKKDYHTMHIYAGKHACREILVHVQGMNDILFYRWIIVGSL